MTFIAVFCSIISFASDMDPKMEINPTQLEAMKGQIEALQKNPEFKKQFADPNSDFMKQMKTQISQTVITQDALREQITQFHQSGAISDEDYAKALEKVNSMTPADIERAKAEAIQKIPSIVNGN